MESLSGELEQADRERTPFARRLLGAALLRGAIYEEVEHDAGATAQAAAVVGLVALSGALGSTEMGPGGWLASIVGQYLGWALWSGTCYFVGMQIFGSSTEWGKLLRTVGFAMAPGILLALQAMPGIGAPFYLAVLGWMVGAVLVATRQALDVSTWRALATAFAGFVPYVLGRLVIEIVLGITPRLLP